MTTEIIEPEIIPVTELEKINATDVALAELRNKALELAAVGTPHKAAYEEIHGLTMVAVKVRTGAMAIAKTLAAPHKSTYDAIIDEGKRIAAHAQATEQIVRPLKEAYETEQERIKDEAAKAEAARIAARIDSLYKLGATFDGLTYNVFGVLIDAVEAKALPDEEWMELYDAANSAYNGEQLRLAIDESERQAEAARLEHQKQEQETERLRLQAIANEQTRLASELQAKQDAFDRQQLEVKAEQVRIVWVSRLERLLSVGFVWNGDTLYYLNFRAQPSMVLFTDHDFNLFIESAIQAGKKNTADEANRAKAQKQVDAEQKRADKERSKRLAPDKKALRAWAIRLGNSPSQLTTQPETDELIVGMLNQLTALSHKFVADIDAL